MSRVSLPSSWGIFSNLVLISSGFSCLLSTCCFVFLYFEYFSDLLVSDAWLQELQAPGLISVKYACSQEQLSGGISFPVCCSSLRLGLHKKKDDFVEEGQSQSLPCQACQDELLEEFSGEDEETV